MDIKSLKDLKNSKSDENVPIDKLLVVESAETFGKMIRENRENKNTSQ